MRKYLIAVAATLCLPLIGTMALAQTPGFTTTSVHMRAGPATSYPVVATLPQDASIEVYGCQSGYNWCDVSWNSARGWISSNYILTDSSGKKSVLNPALAADMGIAVIEFNQAYWENHYEQYPWYANWNHYYHPYHPHHPNPGPYCYHSPQDPACHYTPYTSNHLYQGTPHHHAPHHHHSYQAPHGGYGHPNYHSSPGSSHGGHPHDVGHAGHAHHGGHNSHPHH